MEYSRWSNMKPKIEVSNLPAVCRSNDDVDFACSPLVELKIFSFTQPELSMRVRNPTKRYDATDHFRLRRDWTRSGRSYVNYFVEMLDRVDAGVDGLIVEVRAENETGSDEVTVALAPYRILPKFDIPKVSQFRQTLNFCDCLPAEHSRHSLENPKLKQKRLPRHGNVNNSTGHRAAENQNFHPTRTCLSAPARQEDIDTKLRSTMKSHTGTMHASLPSKNFVEYPSGGQQWKEGQTTKTLKSKNLSEGAISADVKIASLNRSHDSGFFQDGTLENMTSSLNFAGFLHKRRSESKETFLHQRFGAPGFIPIDKSLDDHIVVCREPDRRQSLDTIERWSADSGTLTRKGQEICRKTPPDTAVERIDRQGGAPPSNHSLAGGSGPIRDGWSSNQRVESHHSNDPVEVERSSRRDSSNKSHSVPSNKDHVHVNKSTQRLRELDRTRQASDSKKKDGEASFVEEEEEEEEERIRSTSTSDNFSSFAEDGQTTLKPRKSSAGSGKSRLINKELNPDSKEEEGMDSCNQDGDCMFEMFGSKLSEVCRQLLMSDHSPCEAGGTNTNEKKKRSRKKKDSQLEVTDFPSFNGPDDALECDKTTDVRCEDLKRIEDFKNVCDNSRTFKELSTNRKKPLMPEFSLKVNRQPTWSLDPGRGDDATPCDQEADCVPLYFKFARRRSKEKLTNEKSSDDSVGRSIDGVDDDKCSREERVFPDVDHRGVEIGNCDAAGKSSREKYEGNENNPQSSAVVDDESDVNKTKQSTKLETGKQRYHCIKNSRTRKSHKERSVSRRRKEFLHEIGLEIIKTIEEELRISHKWNGVSPSDTIARRVEQILGDHQEKRIHLGLSESFDQELHNLLIERLVCQDPLNSFPHHSRRDFPFRSPPHLIETWLREDKAYNLEKKLLNLLLEHECRCCKMNNAHKDRQLNDKNEIFDFSQTEEKFYSSGVFDLPTRNFHEHRRDDNKHLADNKSDGNIRIFQDRFDKTALVEESNKYVYDPHDNSHERRFSSTLKKKNVMQTSIPLNDKMLEIVLNVSEPEIRNTEYVGSRSSEVFKRGEFQKPQGNPLDAKDEQASPDVRESLNGREARKQCQCASESPITVISNDRIVVVTESEVCRPTIHFKVSDLTDSSRCSATPGIYKLSLNSEVLDEPAESYDNVPDEERKKPSLLVEEENSGKVADKSVAQMLENSRRVPEVQSDAVFEDDLPTSASHSNTSYQKFKVGSMSSHHPKRKIKVVLSGSSDAGDECKLRIFDGNFPFDGKGGLQESEDLSQLEWDLSCHEVLDVNNNNNPSSNNNNNPSTNNNNNPSTNNNNNNNPSTNNNNNPSTNNSNVGLCSREPVEAATFDTTNATRKDNSKLRKRVTFNQQLILSPSDIEGLCTLTPNKDIPSIEDGPSTTTYYEGSSNNLQFPEEKNQSENSRCLQVTENSLKENSIIQPSGDQSRKTFEAIASENETDNNGYLGGKSDVENTATGEILPSEGSENDLKMTGNSIIIKKREEESFDIQFTKLPKFSFKTDITQKPNPPKILRSMNAIKVTDLNLAQCALRKAFRDREFGRNVRAFDDQELNLGLLKRSCVINKRKQRKYRRSSPDVLEEVIRNSVKVKSVEVQTSTESEFGKSSRDGKSEDAAAAAAGSWFSNVSFSFPIKLGIALLAVALAIVIFFFMADDTKSRFMDFESPISVAFSVE